MDKVKVEVELTKVWVRSSEGGNWKGRWCLNMDKGLCVSGLSHDSVPTVESLQNLMSWSERTTEDPNIQTGEKLVGCLCGISDESLEFAKEAAERLNCLVVIKDFDDTFEDPYVEDENRWKYAYPVSIDLINNLKNKEVL